MGKSYHLILVGMLNVVPCSPFIVLVLNQLLLGFVFLFGLLLSGQDPLPPVGPWFAALTVWAAPNLVKLGRGAGSEARAPKLFTAVTRTMRAGYLMLAAILAVAVLLQIVFHSLPWWLIGFVAFAAANFAEGRQLTRQLDSLKVLDP